MTTVVVKISLPTLYLFAFFSQVCEEARCPNRGECWKGGEENVPTATIMVRSLFMRIVHSFKVADISWVKLN